MAKVIVFGLKDLAELAHFYLTHDSEHSVEAFSVHKEYMPEESLFHGLPVVAFESVETIYPPNEFSFFVPMTALRMNRRRESVYKAVKEKGYSLISYISSRATTYPGAEIGENCFVFEDNTIQPFTKIGNNVTLWSGNHIGHHSVIKDHVFFTSHVVLSGNCVVESYCYLGVNATIRDRTQLATGSLIAMGACVVGDTEPWGIYKGVPAKKSPHSSKSAGF